MNLHKISILYLLSIIIAIFPVSIINAQDSISIDYLGSDVWGGCRDIKVVGNYVYLSMERGLEVLNISDPTLPEFAGKIDFDTHGEGVFVDGNYAYLCGIEYSLPIIDVSDPNSPEMISEYTDLIYSNDLQVINGIAYIAAYSGLKIVDVSDPFHSTTISCFEIEGANSSIFISGNCAYITTSDGLDIIDISDINNPNLIGEYITGSSGEDIIVEDDYAILSTWSDGIIVLDISNPANPVYTARISAESYGNSNWIGDYVYTACYPGLIITDISDPINPATIALYPTIGQVFNVFACNDKAYFWDRYMGFHIADITIPSEPLHIGSYEFGNVYSVYGNGDYILAADGYPGLQVINASDPTRPYVCGKCRTPGQSFDVYSSSHYAYVADGDSGFQIIDISVPSNPVIVGNCDTTGHANGVFVHGNYAYVADNEGLFIVDIYDITNPRIVTIADVDYACKVFVSQDYAFVACDVGGLVIFNIANPSNPIRISQYLSGGAVYDVFVSGDYAYIANGFTDFQIVDISDIENPVLAGNSLIPRFAQGIYVYHNYAFVADKEDGLLVFDVTDPSNPQYAGEFNGTDESWDVYVNDSNIYLADRFTLLYLQIDYPNLIDESHLTPDIYALFQNCPNPFNAHTIISYDLPRQSDVTIDIFDILGRKVERLTDTNQPAGNHQAIWNASDVASGMYFYKLTAGDFSESKQMMLVK